MADPPSLIATTSLPRAAPVTPIAAAIGVCLAGDRRDGVVLLEALGAERRRPTLLSSRAARELEGALGKRAAARGSLCWLTIDAADLVATLAAVGSARPTAVVAVLDPSGWRDLVDAEPPGLRGVALSAELPRQRSLAALVVGDARERGLAAGIFNRPAGIVATRRAVAGIEPGGELGTRARRFAARVRRVAGGEAGQALPLVLTIALATVAVGTALAILGAAATGGSRLQRAADLAAISAARSLRDDHPRLFAPPRLPGGAVNPQHLSDARYRARARRVAIRAARENGAGRAVAHVSFPDVGFAPTRVRVSLDATVAAGEAEGTPRAAAVAEAYPAAPAPDGGRPALATGGGYSGQLEERQGEGMRPDAATAYDRMEAAARAADHALVINSGFRSDAKQAALFAANPDPRWVAPPGTSLHRCATELDLGPPSAYAWLAANAARFGFVRRYEWEPWHLGYESGPPPCSAAGDRVGVGRPDGLAAATSLPAFVPARYRAAISRAASRWSVSPALLAAQLLAESNFNPFAVSPAGARGIAQFMPATAAAYGLDDPFDPEAAIDAQARLMADLLRQFDGSAELALAAYNAGPGAIAACRCVPPYPETQAYVARIMGLLAGAGVAPPPELEVRLVE